MINLFSERWYGVLNVIGSNNLIGSGTIQKFGFLRVDTVFLEEVSHYGDGLS